MGEDFTTVRRRSKLVACETCGHEIAKSATMCPHCGARQRMGLVAQLLRGVVIAFLIVLIGIIGVYLTSGTSDPSLPTCDSHTAQSEVARAMEGAPMGKVLGLRLIKITNVKEVSASDKERRCRGTAQLSNARNYPITYKFYVDAENDVMVEAQVKGL